MISAALARRPTSIWQARSCAASRRREGRGAVDGEQNAGHPPMSEDGRRRNLGRGLSALFAEESEDYAALDRLRQAKTVPIDFVRAGRFQPRRHFDAAALQSLADSIRDKGMLQPI